MTVRERMKAAGFDPDLAKETIGEGDSECEKVRIRIFTCRPWQYGPDAVAVEASGMVPFTDGTLKTPHSSWSGNYDVTAYYPADDLPFAIGRKELEY